MLRADAFEGCEIVLPTLGVEDRLSLDLGGRSLICEPQKIAHTDNGLIVRDSATDTLFLGDLLFSGAIPMLDGSIRGWLTLIEQLQTRKATRVIPGHGPHAMHFPDAVGAEHEYWSVVATDVCRLIKNGETGSDEYLRMRASIRIPMHAAVEISDGVLHMTKAFVKASGGCSAPAPEDADADQAGIGRMLVKSSTGVPIQRLLKFTPRREESCSLAPLKLDYGWFC